MGGLPVGARAHQMMGGGLFKGAEATAGGGIVGLMGLSRLNNSKVLLVCETLQVFVIVPMVAMGTE